MRLVLELQIPADARLLPKTRRALSGYLEESGASDEFAGDVILALDEACANVIRHAFPDGAPGQIDVRVELDEEGIVLQVEDDGIGFDPFRIDLSGELEDTSGRGLTMIRRLVDVVELQSPTETGAGTRVRMHKDLR
jgi:anti-sigma regulatory factor (Ser/Thr protein kinase)